MAKVLFAQPNPGWQWETLTEACRLNQAALYPANRWAEAKSMMGALYPEVVVCALVFFDGDWRKVLRLAGEARVPCNVIVVSQHEDVPVYITAMESGAYDFATLQTSTKDQAWILRCAIENAESRREAIRAEAMSLSG